jgi:GT2 family glycosyltransferase
MALTAAERALTLIGEGEAAFTAGRLRDARVAFEAALAADPTNRDAGIDLAVCLQACGQVELALGRFAEMLANDPADRDAAEGVGVCLVAAGRSREAVRVLEQTVAGLSVTAEITLARAWLAIGDPVKARQHAGNAARLAPDEPEASELRALLDDVLAQRGFLVSPPDPRAAGTPDELVSVLVAVHNGALLLRETLDSVAAQTHAWWELIVVDDGSTDASHVVAESFAGTQPSGRVRVLRQANAGAAAARNHAASLANGRYLLPLDADDVLCDHYLDRAIGAIESHDRCDIAYPLLQAFGAETWLATTGPFTLPALREKNRLPACSLIRRRTFEQLGGYCAAYRGYEDWELWIRACHAGARAVLIPDVLYLYRRVSGSKWDRDLADHDRNVAEIVVRNPTAFDHARVEKARILLAGERLAS